MGSSETKRMCLHKFLGECPKCQEDFDTRHHPNNLDCPRFYPIAVGFVEVVESKEKKNSRVPMV